MYLGVLQTRGAPKLVQKSKNAKFEAPVFEEIPIWKMWHMGAPPIGFVGCVFCLPPSGYQKDIDAHNLSLFLGLVCFCVFYRVGVFQRKKNGVDVSSAFDFCFAFFSYMRFGQQHFRRVVMTKPVLKSNMVWPNC